MIRLALQILVHDRTRFIGIVLGIAFAALLITQQMAIFMGLLNRSGTAIGDVRQAQVWVLDPSQDAIDLDGVRPLSTTALDRVRGVSEIAWAAPHYRVPTTITLGAGARRSCLLVGIDGGNWVGAPPILISGHWEDLRGRDAVIVDEDGMDKLWRPTPGGGRARLAVGDEVEINDHRATVVGIARCSRPIYFAPSVFATSEHVLQWIPATRRQLSYIVAGVRPGIDPREAARAVAAATGLKAMASSDFAASSARFFAANTGVPINFGISTALGFLVGVAVSGLLFLQFVHDNLRHFAALKAMGARNRSLLAMTLAQALTVGAIGYGIGIGLAAVTGLATGSGTATLAWYQPVWLLLAVGAAVLAIVSIAALLGMRRVLAIDPAIVFRG